MKKILLVMILCSLSWAQTVRTTASQEGTNTFAGNNTFNLPLILTPNVTPSAVTSGTAKAYIDSVTKRLCSIDDTLTVTCYGTGSGISPSALTCTGTDKFSAYDTGTGAFTCTADSSGGGTPAGADTQIQFNDGGSAFGANAGLTYDKTGVSGKSLSVSMADPFNLGETVSWEMDGDGEFFLQDSFGGGSASLSSTFGLRAESSRGTGAYSSAIINSHNTGADGGAGLQVHQLGVSGANTLYGIRSDTILNTGGTLKDVVGAEIAVGNRSGSAAVTETGLSVFDTGDGSTDEFIGVNVTPPTSCASSSSVCVAMKAKGGIQNTSASAKPTCDAAHRGIQYFTTGGAGVADAFEVCDKNSADVYGWATATAGAIPTGTGFVHVTSGSQDGASVAETGTGSVVRAGSPTITTPTFSGTATGSISGNAGTATALASSPTQCSGATPIATGVAASGNANCTALTLSGLPTWIQQLPDSYPSSANAMDDEFEAGTLDAKWTAFNAAAALTTTFANGRMVLTEAGGDTGSLRGYYQALPAGNWSFAIKLYGDAPTSGGNNAFGIVLRESSTGKLIADYQGNSGGTWKLLIEKWTTASAFSANAGSISIVQVMPQYLKIVYDGTNYEWWTSNNGVSYHRDLVMAKAAFFTTAADGIGVAIFSANTGVVTDYIEFFRRFN